MSKRSTIAAVFKQVAEAGFPTVQFRSGSPGNLAEVELGRNEVFIALGGEYTLKRDGAEAHTKSSGNFSYYIAIHDDSDTGTVEEEAILATAEVLNEQYLQDVVEVGQRYGFSLTGISETPVYKRTGETLSGLLITATLTITAIPENEFKVAKRVYIDKDIHPYNWPDTNINEQALPYQ